MRQGALFVLIGLIGCNPPLPAAFQCTQDEECLLHGVQGSCEQTGACSFPDVACASGSRYASHSGDGLANLCVTPCEPQGAAATTSPSGGVPFTLTIAALDLDMAGRVLHMWTLVDQGTTRVRMDYTPIAITQASGTYAVNVANFNDLVFAHWENRCASNIRIVAPQADTTIKAYYHSGGHTGP